MHEALRASGAGLVPSFVLAGGVLTGKYDDGGTGRADKQLDDPGVAGAREVGHRLRALGSEVGASPAALAIAFALAHPGTASVLVGATTPAQIDENAGALALDPGIVERVLEL
jgi:aryl-alcohol dehydrogenase-like predicted oxidoreductase